MQDYENMQNDLNNEPQYKPTSRLNIFMSVSTLTFWLSYIMFGTVRMLGSYIPFFVLYSLIGYIICLISSKKSLNRLKVYFYSTQELGFDQTHKGIRLVRLTKAISFGTLMLISFISFVPVFMLIVTKKSLWYAALYFIPSAIIVLHAFYHRWLATQALQLCHQKAIPNKFGYDLMASNIFVLLLFAVVIISLFFSILLQVFG